MVPSIVRLNMVLLSSVMLTQKKFYQGCQYFDSSKMSAEHNPYL